MPRTEVRQTTASARSDEQTIASLIQEIRQLSDRVQVLETLCTDLQASVREMEDELENVAATVDPDL